ncbi:MULTISPECIES: YjzC family protein [Paenibacillus]|uniref:YjzC family protein n=1 Tax=Paenibacillus sambharensis TaxID=1803190 RepID=A0A2W1LNV4_9BACL|nr:MULTISPECIES: YjzC family protein [Paenibacillus]MCF2944526.1 YjzC family protein [Paenibacillus tarimensis]PZD96612.1 YjzC family protein [Paenibacillus sambharensis]
MGEWTHFTDRHTAPNDGIYIEVGEHAVHTGVNNPRKVKLKKGQRFPELTNEDRRWTRMK